MSSHIDFDGDPDFDFDGIFPAPVDEICTQQDRDRYRDRMLIAPVPAVQAGKLASWQAGRLEFPGCAGSY